MSSAQATAACTGSSSGDNRFAVAIVPVRNLLKPVDQRLQFGKDGLRMFFGIGGEPNAVAEQHRHILIALGCEPAVELQRSGDRARQHGGQEFVGHC
jgi:hypothetical protein